MGWARDFRGARIARGAYEIALWAFAGNALCVSYRDGDFSVRRSFSSKRIGYFRLLLSSWRGHVGIFFRYRCHAHDDLDLGSCAHIATVCGVFRSTSFRFAAMGALGLVWVLDLVDGDCVLVHATSAQYQSRASFVGTRWTMDECPLGNVVDQYWVCGLFNLDQRLARSKMARAFSNAIELGS